MVAFEVYLNGEKLFTAGIGDLGVLSAILSWSRVHREDRKTEGPKEDLTLHVGGLDTTDQCPKWLDRPVARGDEIRIKIVETLSVDEPREQARVVRSDPREDAKKYVRQMAKKLGWKIQE